MADNRRTCIVLSDEEEGHASHKVSYKYNSRTWTLPYWYYDPFEFVKKKVEGFKLLADLGPDELMYLTQEVCKRDSLTMLYLLVENGLDPKWLGTRFDECSTTDEAVSIMNIVIESINDEQLSFVKFLVKSGWSVNAPSENERNLLQEGYMLTSPLASGLKNKCHSVVKYLIEQGAVLSGVELRCCGTFNADMVRMMLRYKPETEESTLRHILIRMLTCGSSSESFYLRMLCDILEWILPVLIQTGININTLHFELYASKPESIAEFILDRSYLSDRDIPTVLEILVSYGLNLNKCCLKNGSLLAICVTKQSLHNSFNFLLQHGLKINYTGGTPLLHHTLREGRSPKNSYYDDEECSGYVDDTWFPLLLELGADVNLEDSSGASLYEKLLCRHGDNNEKYLMYLLLNTDIKVKASNLSINHFVKMSFLTLVVLINAGCRDNNVINAAWKKIWPKHLQGIQLKTFNLLKIDAPNPQRIQLLKLAAPLFLQIKPDLLEGYKNYAHSCLDNLDIPSTPSLQTWCVNSVHKHLFLNVTKGKAIIQKLNIVSGYLPRNLAGILNFKAFYTSLESDCGIPEMLKEYLCEQEPQPIVAQPEVAQEVIIGSDIASNVEVEQQPVFQPNITPEIVLIDSEVPSDLVIEQEIVVIDSESEQDVSATETNSELWIEGSEIVSNNVQIEEIQPDILSNIVREEDLIVIEPETQVDPLLPQEQVLHDVITIEPDTISEAMYST